MTLISEICINIICILNQLKVSILPEKLHAPQIKNALLLVYWPLHYTAIEHSSISLRGRHTPMFNEA